MNKMLEWWSKLKREVNWLCLSIRNNHHHQQWNFSYSSSVSTTASLNNYNNTNEIFAIAADPDSDDSTLSNPYPHNLTTISTCTKFMLQKSCAICLGRIRARQGQAIFTSECAHSFHFNCIVNNVEHGNYSCPICRSKWNDIPFQLPSSNADSHSDNVGPDEISPIDYSIYHTRTLLSPSSSNYQSLQFSDDEPLPAPSTSYLSRALNMNVKTIPGFPSSTYFQNFPVLVSIRAPPLMDDADNVVRAPIDLVTVLDVSASMGGSKLALLKQYIHFVVDNLGPSDRLAIVCFSSSAERILPLRRMTDDGREDAKRTIDSISLNSGTNIVEGLKKGARVLEERRERNPCAGIILVSDGQDTFNGDNANQSMSHSEGQAYCPLLNFLPVSICPRNTDSRHVRQNLTFPVHSFGFGTYHDSSIMQTISDASGGIFSIIESDGMGQNTFASFIGCLLNLVAQDLDISVRSATSRVKISSIFSETYSSDISEDGCLASIKVGDVCADENKEFLLYLSVPKLYVVEGAEDIVTTSPLDITCSYKESVSGDIIYVEGPKLCIGLPHDLSPSDLVDST